MAVKSVVKSLMFELLTGLTMVMVINTNEPILQSVRQGHEKFTLPGADNDSGGLVVNSCFTLCMHAPACPHFTPSKQGSCGSKIHTKTDNLLMLNKFCDIAKKGCLV